MKNNFERPNLEGPNPDIRTSLTGKGGHGSKYEKRASMAMPFEKILAIFQLLPYDSRARLGNQLEYIKKDPKKAIGVFRKEVEIQRDVLDMLDNGVSPDELLEMIDELLPKETIQ